MNNQPVNELTPTQVFSTLTRQNAEANENTRKALEEIATERKRFVDAHTETMDVHRKYIDLLDRHIAQSKVLMLDVLAQVKALAAPEPAAPTVYEYMPPQKNIDEAEKTKLEAAGWIMYREEGHPVKEEGMWDVMLFTYYRRSLLNPTAPDTDDASAEADLSLFEDALPDNGNDDAPTEVPAPATPDDEPTTPPQPDTLPELVPPSEAPTQPSPTTPEPEKVPAQTADMEQFKKLNGAVLNSGCMKEITVSDAFVEQDSGRVYKRVEPHASPELLGILGYQPVHHVRLNNDYPNEYLVTFGLTRDVESMEGHETLYLLDESERSPVNTTNPATPDVPDWNKVKAWATFMGGVRMSETETPPATPEPKLLTHKLAVKQDDRYVFEDMANIAEVARLSTAGRLTHG
ncbi:MAG: hypothetical protein AAF787_00125 [Chloroflexota bacterium]